MDMGRESANDRPAEPETRHPAARGVKVSHFAAWQFFMQGASLSKNLHASEQGRPDVARRRAQWRIGALLSAFSPAECANYFVNAGCASK